MECEDCGVGESEDSSVKETTCPFADEINGSVINTTLCCECYSQRCMAI